MNGFSRGNVRAIRGAGGGDVLACNRVHGTFIDRWILSRDAPIYEVSASHAALPRHTVATEAEIAHTISGRDRPRW
jgi:hypothetical protein